MLVNHVWTLYNFAIKDYLWSHHILPLHLKKWYTLESETISSHKWPPEIVQSHAQFEAGPAKKSWC